jgi:hypothetical protein
VHKICLHLYLSCLRLFPTDFPWVFALNRPNTGKDII